MAAGLAIGALAALSIFLIVLSRVVASGLDPVQVRLQQIAVRPRTLEELELQRPMSERTIKPIIELLARLVGRFYPANTVHAVAVNLKRAGMETTSVEFFLGVKAFAAIIGALGGAALVNAITLDATQTMVAIPVGLFIGFKAPDFYLSNKAQKRSSDVLDTLPDALDLLTIAVEAGLGFDAAIVKMTEKMKGALAEEFKRAAGEQRVGKSRQEALRGIVERVEQKELQNFIAAIIQADQLGVSMSKVLRIQSEQLRMERRQRAEERAAKAPVMIMLPTIGCIFPALFVVILGPAALSAMSSCGSF
ncbi:MAG: type II secretion system F family protein [Chloroflexota bacterium]|nr:type II secretion system F family protein [Chloroflexota bacterium]MDE3192474.1 type II secretion system F family protein [Chloroflexota bacterium]